MYNKEEKSSNEDSSTAEMAHVKKSSSKSVKVGNITKSRGKEVLFKPGDTLPPEIGMLDYQRRPMIWRDLPDFKIRHGRNTADMIYDLGLLTSHAVALKTPSTEILPFDLELLIRMYDRSPSSCAWNRPSVRAMFEALYGDLIEELGKDVEDAARLALGRRYATLLGRVATAQYRWLTGDGLITRRLGYILLKTNEIKTGEHPRAFFEHISVKMWLLRGFDVNAVLPLPTRQSLAKQEGGRGRTIVPKANQAPHVTPVYKGGAFA